MKTVQVGTLETIDEITVLQSMIAKSILFTFLPKRLKRSRSILRESGNEVKPAAIPNEARMKKTTGFANPVSADAKSGVAPSRGIRPRKVQHIIVSGSASVIRMARNARTRPIVLTPATERASTSGTKNMPTNIIPASAKPTICFFEIFFTIYITPFHLVYCDALHDYMVAILPCQGNLAYRRHLN